MLACSHHAVAGGDTQTILVLERHQREGAHRNLAILVWCYAKVGSLLQRRRQQCR